MNTPINRFPLVLLPPFGFKGGQTVGDQLFESFLRKSRSSTILASHRSERNLNLLAIVAVGTALVGSTTQFIALRAMHATITVAQLGVVLLMTALRSFAQMQRIGANDLPLAHQRDAEELNWLANRLLRCDRWDVTSSLPTPPPANPRQSHHSRYHSSHQYPSSPRHRRGAIYHWSP